MSSNAERRRRWFQFGLGTLLTFTAGVGVGLFLAWSFYIQPLQPQRPSLAAAEDRPADADLIEYLKANRTDPSCQGLLDNLGLEQSNAPGLNRIFLAGKHLAFHSRYAVAENEHRRVFVYDPHRKGSFENNSESIVITDAECRLIAWKEVGGGTAMLKAAEFSYSKKNEPALTLVRDHVGIGTPGVGSYQFSLAGDQVQQIGNVEWPKPNYAEIPPFPSVQKMEQEETEGTESR
jgi:hypothetical protein